MYVKTLACWLILSCALLAQEGPKAVITDPNGGPPPERIENREGVVYLSAKQAVCGDKPDSLIWLVKPSSRAERVKTYENGRELVVPLGEGSYTLVITQVAVKGDSGSVAEVTIQVGKGVGPNPDPEPEPEPDPGPGPTPVDGLGKIVIRDLKPAIEKKLADLNDRDDFKLKASFVSLSAGYRQLSKEIADGKYANIDQLLDSTKTLTRAALGSYLDVWTTTIRSIEKELQDKQPDLKSLEKHYLEIANGINSVLGV